MKQDHRDLAPQADSLLAASGHPGARVKGFVWAAITVALFSGWFVVTRLAVIQTLGIWDITALRFGIGAVLLAPAVLRRGARLPLAAWGEGLIFAMLWGVPFVLLVALGLKLTSASEAASIVPTGMPVFAGIFAWVFLRERVSQKRLAGYGAILAGLSLLVASGAATAGAPSAAGLAALAGAAAMWAIYTLLFRASGLRPVQAGALICIWSAVLFVPAYLAMGLSRIPEAPIQEIGFQALYQGVLISCVAIISFNRAVALLGAGAATAIVALIPATASLLAVPLLGEAPGPGGWAAIAVIVLGVVLASGSSARRTAPQPAPN